MSPDRTKRSRPDLSPVLPAACLAAFLLSSCATGPASGPFLLHPLPPSAAGYSLAAGALIYEDNELSLRVQPLDPSFVDREVRASGRPNPFPSGPGAPPLLIFDVSLDSRSASTVYFNPANVRGRDDEGERYLPLSLSDFYQLHREDPDRLELLAVFEDLAFDKPTELHLGQRAKGYLVMSPPGSIPATVTLEIPFLLEGRQTRTVSLDFEAFPAAAPSE